ncbi:hypothetical protein Rxycam_02755 [Rubrobacter xylanophilus DSM 9941]|uniref:hypothetical protein n=1 Tax=Rubrobacter xylanophilus TaxID=49319 RepID=UPI001C640B8E|nr:hypothetical protein [Rubrobacter xylanophilus]QYJ16919.1 hypothetical protein Rxycam_02755 [Rubrobacter xylanophilus DSM 9941]
MSREKRPRQAPQRFKEAADPKPDVEPRVGEKEKGDDSSRLEGSREPSENKERRRVARKLREREDGS